jgi:hypothetical protein
MARGRPLVILSAAKDLIAARHRDEILRYAQDDSLGGFAAHRPNAIRRGCQPTLFRSNRSRDFRISPTCARAQEPSGSTAFHKVLPSRVSSYSTRCGVVG